MKLKKVDPQEFGELLFKIDNLAFNRKFDLRARNIQEEVDYFKDCEVFISYQEVIPVGIVGYQIKDKKVEIKTLAVIPEYQGKGIGKEIMTEILFKLKGKEIRLVTHPKYTSAVILYLKSGFEIYGWKENYYGDGEPRLLLMKKI
jgi:ribosomal protein S18 acetylase RimI-like enzyme